MPRIYGNTGNYEFQNYTSITHGTQFIKFGARLREQRTSNYTTYNFLGQFNFASITDYGQFQQGLATGVPLQTLFAAGVGPVQYQQNAGVPLIAGNQFDAGPVLSRRLEADSEHDVEPRVALRNSGQHQRPWRYRSAHRVGLGHRRRAGTFPDSEDRHPRRIGLFLRSLRAEQYFAMPSASTASTILPTPRRIPSSIRTTV